MVAAAALVSVVAFLLYRATLLPGVDFGDSGSFQTMVGSPLLRPRDGYPLYFALGALVLKVTGLPAAHALNLASALAASIACGLFVIVATMLSESVAAAAGGALLFAVSYTFWSQSVTAEVYALHIALVLATFALLLRWEQRPRPARLAAFFACYAIAFGNHLSMILLFPAFVVFLWLAAPRGWRTLVEPRVLALAVGLAAVGASQYLWNLRTLWFLPDPPATVRDALWTFWFDVTKTDWRDTMVLQVPRVMRASRTAMYWFDLRQQFGAAAIVLAIVGTIALAFKSPRRAVLLVLAYLVNVVFAFGYNVGDTHVFYLPSHLIVALLASTGVAALASISSWRATGAAAGALLALYAGVRGYRDFPALDRSSDARAARLLESMTAGLDEQRAIMLVDLNWQIANGLSYFTKVVRPEVVVARVRDVLLYAPALVRDNVEIGRAVALDDHANRILTESYGDLLPSAPDRSVDHPLTLIDVARALPPGTRYALCRLKPTSDTALDGDVDASLRILSPSGGATFPDGDYAAVAGIAGRRPALVAGSNFPFASRVDLDGVTVDVRMESWLDFDSIRRMGFGHVIAARRHTLIVERGVSFVAFDESGSPLRTTYFENIFAMPSRYLIRSDVLR